MFSTGLCAGSLKIWLKTRRSSLEVLDQSLLECSLLLKHSPLSVCLRNRSHVLKLLRQCLLDRIGLPNLIHQCLRQLRVGCGLNDHHANCISHGVNFRASRSLVRNHLLER